MSQDRVKKIDPFAPAPYGDNEVAAIKAMAEGTANPGQQRLAMNWIITGPCMVYNETFVPGQPDVSDNLAGRRNAGLQIVKLINMPMLSKQKEN